MKKLLLLLSFILSVTVSYSQDTLKTKMAALYTVVVQPTPGGPGGAKGLIVSGFLNDPAGVYTVDSVIIGHIVWDASGRRFKILEINSAVGSTISVDVEALTDGTVEFDTGVGCIQSETGSLPVAVLLGLSEVAKQAIAIHTSVVDKYDELQYPYLVGNKLYLTQSIVPVDLDSLGLSLLADSIRIVDTIGGVAVTNMQEAVDALELLTPSLDSIPKTTTTTGLVTNTQVLHGNSNGKIIGSTNFTYASDKLTLRMDNIGASFTQAKSFHLLNTTAATLAVSQVPPLILYQTDGWKTDSPAGTSTIFGEIGFAPFTGSASASSNFFVRGTRPTTGTLGELINVEQGSGFSTSRILVGVLNSFDATHGVVLGTLNTVSTPGIAIGWEALVNGGLLALGNNVRSTHANSGVVGRNLISGETSTWIFGNGISSQETGFTNSGTALIHFTGGTAQLRVQGLTSTITDPWTAAGAVITTTTPDANIAVGQGIALMGTELTNVSYRTIIAVSSTTVFTVSSPPSVASGTHRRTQELNILEVGNGGDSYNRHMIINRSGLVGLGITPTSRLTLAAGTTLVAPVQLTSGTNLTTPINGAVEFDGTNYFVTTASTRHILSKTLTGTGVLNYGSIASLATETLTITVTGAAIGDVVMVGIDNASKSTGLIFGQPWVSATNTVSVEAYNSTGSAIDPTSGTFRASVIKY